MIIWMMVRELAAAVLQAHGGHGVSPDTANLPAFYEYVLVAIAVVVMVWAVYKAVRVSVHPGEEEPNHIKRLILEDEDAKSHG